ncbi:hypothetical protein MHSWG343_02600 [Candidatus Mycoplasma haematohominis]|uniref:Uncharacterized protein n=2 Tax=Candidatus Mycoplasma haematohominis TaxID=1494318 RepID=A0A478FPJ5_9MOLU|nr:hypothetical protein MHSWG343_02600 [Candidatus Mycoplasma haemohominis]
MHKVFNDMRNTYKEGSSLYVKKEEFDFALDELMSKYLVGKNRFGKYFIDYLDYEETGVEGEGYIDLDKDGNGFITIKSHRNEYRKSSYFVHKKNIGEAKSGDYVRFVELKVTNKKQFVKFALIDVKVKEVLSPPNIS